MESVEVLTRASGIPQLVSSIVVAASLIWAQALQAQPQAPADSEDKLCGPASAPDGKPRVVVGRFLQFGEFEPNLSRSLEYGFTGSLVGALLNRGDAAIFAWRGDAEQLRQFRDLSEQIDKAFVGGTPKDSQRQVLVAALKANNCQYLLGGRLSKEGGLLGVTLYRLDVEEGEISRFSPVFGDVQALMRAADRFSAEFGTFLRQRRLGTAAPRVVEAGCISVLTPLSIARSERQKLAVAMRQRLAQVLSSDKRFQVKRVASDTGTCPAPENVSSDATLILSAQLRRSRDTIEIRPVLKIPETVAGSKISISLPSVGRPASEIVALPAAYADAIRAFLLVATREDGSLPEDFLSPPPSRSDGLLEIFEQDLQERTRERSALAAYRFLATNPNSAVASYILGRLFLFKEQPQLALDYLLRARERSDDPPLIRHAELNEAAGDAQHELKRFAESVEYLRDARSLFAQDGRDRDALRVGRKVAIALFLSGDKEKAVDELRTQPSLEKDTESLRLLGMFAIFLDQYIDATAWLRKALAIDPNDAASKTYLAYAYQGIGEKELAADRYAEARDNFDLAAKQRRDSQTSFLAGFAAYKLGDYDDVVSRLERVLADHADISGDLLDYTWLNLLEAYLLLGRYDQLERRSDAAAEALASRPDARLLATYLRFCARAIRDASKTGADLEKDPVYQEILGAPPAVSAKNLSSWDNTNIEKHLASADLPPDKRGLVDVATKRVWRDTKK
jgi:tetratricopeptide (TPR) repeat protein